METTLLTDTYDELDLLKGYTVIKIVDLCVFVISGINWAIFEPVFYSWGDAYL